MTDVQPVPTDPQALAEAVTAAMWSRDRTAQALGMRIESVGPGRATVRMTVRGDMVNGHHICHGGLIFTLADTAFAYACNAYNRNTVASGCNIDFVATGREGDTLQAEAVERTLADAPASTTSPCATAQATRSPCSGARATASPAR